MAEAYYTIGKEAQIEYVEKRSRFIACVRPVKTEEEAQAFIQSKKKQYWDARHNVYAYILDNGNLCRFSDDGEPQGTAGIPALDVLRKQQLTDCAVVITRYFGGILLGGGGLVRAYSHSTGLALEEAGTVWMRPCVKGTVVCSYTQYGWLPAFLLENGAVTEEAVFEENVALPFVLPEENRGKLESALTDRSAGSLTVRWGEQLFCPFSVKKQ